MELGQGFDLLVKLLVESQALTYVDSCESLPKPIRRRRGSGVGEGGVRMGGQMSSRAGDLFL